MEHYDIVVAGAGASGLIAAIRAAELGNQVLVVEKMDRAGRKLLITGKGRCNITNMASQNEYYQHIYPRGRFLKHAFASFFSQDIIGLLNNQGVETTVERGGRVFPTSNRSADVLKALLERADTHQIAFRYHSSVNRLLVDSQKVVGVEVLQNGKPEQILAKKIIVCTGGKSYPATGSTGDGYTLAKEVGHSVTQVNPSLVPLVTREEIDEHLHDLTLKNVRATLWINGKKQMGNLFKMWFPSAMIPLFMEKTGITASREASQITASERRKIKMLMKNLA